MNEKKTAWIHVRLTARLHHAAQQLAAENDGTVSALVVRLLEKEMKRLSRKQGNQQQTFNA